jgi:hypothetical protein
LEALLCARDLPARLVVLELELPPSFTPPPRTLTLPLSKEVTLPLEAVEAVERVRAWLLIEGRG